MYARFLIAGLMLVVGHTASAMDCPIGSYPWVDNWGNQTCQRPGGGTALTHTPPGAQCPTGSYPWTDSWGNQVCKSFGAGPTYYDTSRGCPTGFAPWVDNWGNPICRRM